MGDVQSDFIDLVSIKVELPITVSIKEQFSNKNEEIIYPNPGTGIFYLKNEKKKIEVFNAMGCKIQHIENAGEIDLRQAPKGIYIIRISEEQNFFSTKVTFY